MTLSKLSRRDFLKGAGATGMVGALALGGAGVAFAEEGTASGEAAATANPYSQALGEDASLLPMRHAECPGPHGPVAFEDRTIGDDEIVSTADTEVLVIGAGIGGIMASLKAAEEGAKVLRAAPPGRASVPPRPPSRRSRASSSMTPSSSTRSCGRATGAPIRRSSRPT